MEIVLLLYDLCNSTNITLTSNKLQQLEQKQEPVGSACNNESFHFSTYGSYGFLETFIFHSHNFMTSDGDL